MISTLTFFQALSLAPIAAAQLLAGGFWLQSGNPDANAEAKAAKAVVLVRAVGCHEPENAEVVGTAIGSVDGQRRSIPLKLIKLTTPRAYAAAPQWPTEGKWVLEFVAKCESRVTSAVFPATGDSVQRMQAKYFPHKPTDGELDAVLGVAER